MFCVITLSDNKNLKNFDLTYLHKLFALSSLLNEDNSKYDSVQTTLGVRTSIFGITLRFPSLSALPPCALALDAITFQLSINSVF